MSGKLPDGWFNPFPGDLWSHPTGATADLHRPHGNFRAAVYGPDRSTKEEAEQDRLNLIAGLEGGADLLKAREQIDTLTARLDRAAERHDAIVECLDSLGAPCCGGIPKRIEALAERGEGSDALARMGRTLNAVRAELDNVRRFTAFSMGGAVQERDAALKELATLKNRRAGDHAEHLATLNEISKELNAYPTVDGVTVHYGPHEIAGAVRAQGKALHEAREDRARLAGELEAVRDGDPVPQLLRDSMRVTQEESARVKADMARKDAEIAALRQRVAASEAYAQHLLAALNTASGFKGPQ